MTKIFKGTIIEQDGRLFIRRWIKGDGRALLITIANGEATIDLNVPRKHFLNNYPNIDCDCTFRLLPDGRIEIVLPPAARRLRLVDEAQP